MNRSLKRRLRRKAIVATKDGRSFSGVLFEADRDALVLRDAKAILGSDGAEVSVDGELLLFASDVAYMQLP